MSCRTAVGRALYPMQLCPQVDGRKTAIACAGDALLLLRCLWVSGCKTAIAHG